MKTFFCSKFSITFLLPTTYASMLEVGIWVFLGSPNFSTLLLLKSGVSGQSEQLSTGLEMGLAPYALLLDEH